MAERRLGIRGSCEGALIDGLPADNVKAGDEREIKQVALLGQGDGHSSRQMDSAHRLGSTFEGSEVRSRCVLKDFATTVRDDVFAPTPSPLSVHGLLL